MYSAFQQDSAVVAVSFRNVDARAGYCLTDNSSPVARLRHLYTALVGVSEHSVSGVVAVLPLVASEACTEISFLKEAEQVRPSSGQRLHDDASKR